ncbi:glutathione S-transferase [Acinetobacter tandoii]|nr:glutathione S-transferase [Acinetobacter tandoii]
MHIQLYHKPNSRSQRIIWLFEELGLDYDILFCPTLDDTNTHHLEQIHPLAKFPTVKITEHQHTFFLSETSAIAEWFSVRQQSLGTINLDNTALTDYYYWKNFADASFMPNLALKQIISQMAIRTPWLVRFIPHAIQYGFNRSYLNPLLQQQMHMINQHLTTQTWLAGSQLTIADILLWFPLQACTHLATCYADYPATNRYLQQIQDRPAFQRAL